MLHSAFYATSAVFGFGVGAWGFERDVELALFRAGLVGEACRQCVFRVWRFGLRVKNGWGCQTRLVRRAAASACALTPAHAAISKLEHPCAS